jgi:tetratricopeptide (TPR) repeat protein
MDNLNTNNQSTDSLEKVAVYGSAVGSIAAIILSFAGFNGAAFATASLPLSASGILNLKNRQELLKSHLETKANHANSIASLLEAKTNHDSTLENHASLIAAHDVNIVEVTGSVHFAQKALDAHSLELNELKNATQELAKLQQEMQESLQAMNQIESLSIQSYSASEQFYFRRGLLNQYFGNNSVAVKDFSEAIRLNPKNVGAFYNRGIVRSLLGAKQGAVDDLRSAAKFYFEDGDLDNYQKAKDLSLSIHEFESQTETTTADSSEKVLVTNLFS